MTEPTPDLVDRLIAYPGALGMGDALEVGFCSAMMREAAEEIMFWRREAYARAWMIAARTKDARERNLSGSTIALVSEGLTATLNAIDGALAKEWRERCAGCGKFLNNGDNVLHYEDGVTSHTDCDRPVMEELGGGLYDDSFTPSSMASMLTFAREEQDALRGAANDE